MRPQTRPTDRKTQTFKYSSVFFNLLAVAVLLTAIVVLHQILSKPKSPSEETAVKKENQVKAVAALPTTTTPEDSKPAAKNQMAVVDLEVTPEEKKSEPEKEIKTVKWKKVKHTAKKKYTASSKTNWAEGPSVEELDNEAARQRYLKQNKGTPVSEKSADYNDTYSSRRYETPRADYVGSSRLPSANAHSSDLDSEAARQKYLEENRRLSGPLAYKTKNGQNAQNSAASASSANTSNEYIPFER